MTPRITKYLAYGLSAAAVLFGLAILVILWRLASVEVDTRVQSALPDIPIPPSMARALKPIEVTHAAFETPIYAIDGDPFTLPDLKGQGVVLNFWATWCTPCVREMPALDALAAALQPHGVQVIAVSEDRKAADIVPRFLDNLGIENIGRHYDDKGRLSRHLGVKGLPTTVLIDAQGRFIGQVVGVLDWDSPDTIDFLIGALAPTDNSSQNTQ